nr:MAG TPA: hypothetical protein [Caudoviricetes sp.]
MLLITANQRYRATRYLYLRGMRFTSEVILY